jgi:hypothetical protein
MDTYAALSLPPKPMVVAALLSIICRLRSETNAARYR